MLTECYKVETIGDGALGVFSNGLTSCDCSTALMRILAAAFIVCAGAPEPRALAASVLAVTSCARALLSVVERYRTPTSRRRIKMRIGCHAGVVLGAVMGRSMVRLCTNRCMSCSSDTHNGAIFLHMHAR